MFKLGADALGLAGQWHPCSQATSATFSTWLGRRVWALTTAWLCSSIQTSPNKCFSAGRTQRLFLAGQTQISACSFYFFWTYIMYALCPWEKKKKMPTPPWSSALQLCLLWWWVAWHPWLPAALQLHSSHANCPSQHWVLSLAPALGSTRQSQVLSLRSALSATTTGCQRARVKIITSEWKHKYYQHRWLPCHWT